jgi:ADP-ribosyl-[dinitrogen reductase] hydrolase
VPSLGLRSGGKIFRPRPLEPPSDAFTKTTFPTCCISSLTAPMDAAPDPQWYPDAYVSVAKDLEGNTKYRPRGGAYVDYEGPMWGFAEEKVNLAYRDGLSVVDACNSWYSGAFLLETVPSVLYILTRHGGDPEGAIVRAVNDTKDNDTVAAIVGAAKGALHGRSKLPLPWVKNLAGRTTDRDDGRVFELLNQARAKWG